eukprot:CAMPEP_0185749148 /NCGR_PEP_ID=MMETSP1174-20130828/7881_1 /TAXON_ID=35687 /ORGANISM="Dictyocha speculum, Strain CCMP1381" /LENGTH=101 /DNA_ID=CAMNT_0028425143 /DNA_START=290 /DNA_END=596 /DNA_ORIENTATION=+
MRRQSFGFFARSALVPADRLKHQMQLLVGIPEVLTNAEVFYSDDSSSDLALSALSVDLSNAINRWCSALSASIARWCSALSASSDSIARLSCASTWRTLSL